MTGIEGDEPKTIGAIVGRAYPLAPDRHQPDFFLCDVLDAAPKGDIGSMEHPIFSLSTKPDRRTRVYENGGVTVEVQPSAKGLATIHDRDILIYCISQAISALNDGKQIAKTVRFHPHDFLKSTNRMTNGNGYKGFKDALERLRGTTVSTNIETGGKATYTLFGLIESAEIKTHEGSGRTDIAEIVLSDWIFRAIETKEVLTLNRQYFRLRSPLQRRLYELARKHCGRQTSWKIGIEKLQQKTGSNSSQKEFRRMINDCIEQDTRFRFFPDYSIGLASRDIIEFRKRPTIDTALISDEEPADAPIKLAKASSDGRVSLKSGTYEKARELAPGYDIHGLEATWRTWMEDGGLDAPKNADTAFLGFCKKHFERNGAPR